MKASNRLRTTLFYRGFYRKIGQGENEHDFSIKTYKKIKHQSTRKPKDTQHIHDLLNDKSEEKFGWRIRNGIFTITDKYQANHYGTPYIFIPIGDYKYVHNDHVIDLTAKLDEDGIIEMSVYIAELRVYLDNLIDGYESDKLYMSDTETSFMCESYYLINIQYEDMIYDLLKN